MSVAKQIDPNLARLLYSAQVFKHHLCVDVLRSDDDRDLPSRPRGRSTQQRGMAWLQLWLPFDGVRGGRADAGGAQSEEMGWAKHQQRRLAGTRAPGPSAKETATTTDTTEVRGEG